MLKRDAAALGREGSNDTSAGVEGCKNGAVPSLFASTQRLIEPAALPATEKPITPTLFDSERRTTLHGIVGCLVCMGIANWNRGDFADMAEEAQSLPKVLANAVPEWSYYSFVVVVCLVIISCAVWESVKFPRLVSMGTTDEKLRTMLQLLGDILLIPVFAVLSPEKPILGFAPTARNMEIVSKCPSLSSFKMTAWLRNPYLALTVLMFRDGKEAIPSKAMRFQRELVQAEDGGVVALDWWTAIPKIDTVRKILFIGSTFTGDSMPSTQQDLCRTFAADGWHVVVMVKRGCGLTVPNMQPKTDVATTQPWCFNGLDDIEMSINHVARSFPDATICGAGLSCGGSQLRNYVNITGSRSKLKACVVVDAAEEWPIALRSIDKRQPIISAVLAMSADSALQACNVDPPSSIPTSLSEFAEERMAPSHGFLAGREGGPTYMRYCQPADPAGCTVPVLEMVSYNDLLIDTVDVEILGRVHTVNPNIINCTTRWGTHIVRWEGLRPTCWITRVAHEFLSAAMTS